MTEELNASRDHAQTAGSALEKSDNIRALYSPSRGEVGCVIIQAAFRGDRRACHIFDSRDWFTSPAPDMTWIEAPMADWIAVAAMSKEERKALPIAKAEGLS